MIEQNISAKVLGCGSPIIDILAHVDDPFLKKYVDGDKGGMVLVDISVINSLVSKITNNPEIVPGGSAANTIRTIAKLGLPTGFLGKVSDDSEGEFYTNYFKNLGSDISRFGRTNKAGIGKCLSMVTPDSQRTMRTYIGAAALIAKEDVSESDVMGFSHLHIEGYMLHNTELVLKLLELAKKNNLTISLDLASFEIVKIYKTVLEEMIETYNPIIFTNEDESMAYTNSDDPLKIFEKVNGKIETICLKLGKKGSIIKNGANLVNIDPVIVDNPLDTTAAGDIWQAGFLYGYLNKNIFKKQRVKKSGMLASLLGAEIVKVLGAIIPENKWAYINRFINELDQN